MVATGTINVVVGILVDDRRRVLIAQRPPGRHLAGGWEFPGGKRESGESALAALERELREELGVRQLTAEPLMTHRHAYPDREVCLDVWWVAQFAPTPVGLEGQRLRWVEAAGLRDAALLPADAPIVERVTARIQQSAS